MQLVTIGVGLDMISAKSESKPWRPRPMPKSFNEKNDSDVAGDRNGGVSMKLLGSEKNGDSTFSDSIGNEKDGKESSS